VVAGKLTHFDAWGRIENHPVRGGTGVLRSHVIYERTSDFLSVATECLVGDKSDSIGITRFGDKLLAWMENIGSLVVLVVSIVLGVVFMYLVALAIGWVIASLFNLPEIVLNMIRWLLLFGTAAGVLWVPKRQAVTIHGRHWSLTQE